MTSRPPRHPVSQKAPRPGRPPQLAAAYTNNSWLPVRTPRRARVGLGLSRLVSQSLPESGPGVVPNVRPGTAEPQKVRGSGRAVTRLRRPLGSETGAIARAHPQPMPSAALCGEGAPWPVGEAAEWAWPSGPYWDAPCPSYKTLRAERSRLATCRPLMRHCGCSLGQLPPEEHPRAVQGLR